MFQSTFWLIELGTLFACQRSAEKICLYTFGPLSLDQDSMESFKRLENFSYTDVRKGGGHSYTYNKKVDTLKTFKIKYLKTCAKSVFFLNLYSCINKREF